MMHGDVNFCQYSFKDVQMIFRKHADSFCCTGASDAALYPHPIRTRQKHKWPNIRFIHIAYNNK